MTDSTQLFDSYGIPAGDATDTFWRMMVSGLFERLAPDGWDQPHGLWAMLNPVATEAFTAGTVGLAHLIDGIAPGNADEADDDTFVPVSYMMVPLGSATTNPREWLPGITAPIGTAALVLITEAWTSTRTIDRLTTGTEEDAAATARTYRMHPDERPSAQPDREEVRQAVLMEPDGTVHMYLHSRGSDVTDPTALRSSMDDGIHVVGVIPDLLRRCFALPVPEDVPVGDVLGRVCLLATAQTVTSALSDPQPDTVGLTVLAVAGGLLDGLDTPYNPPQDEPELVGVLAAAGKRENDLLTGLQRAKSDGIDFLISEARQVNTNGWDAFLTLPGAARWLRSDGEGKALTPALRDWYGPGHRSRFIDERLPSWDEAHLAIVQATSEDVAGFVRALLTDLGWGPRT